MKKYFYKCYYRDGGWDITAEAAPVRNPKQICQTCEKVEIISPVKYFLYWLQGWGIELKLRWERK